MKKIVTTQYLILFIFGISLCLPQLVYAFPNRPFTSPFKRIFLRAVFDLTNDQIDALDELKAATQAEVEPWEDRMKELGMQMPEILLAEEIDTIAAEEMLQEMVDLQCQILSIEANAGLEGFQIITSEKRFLTAEQRQAIVIFAENALDLFEYIADYPGWDKFKDDFEQYIEPAFDDLHPERFSREPLLDLTDEQIADFDQLKDDTRTAIEPLERQIRELSVQMLGTLMADPIMIADAEGTLQLILDAQCQSLSIGAASLLEGVQILTPEQRQLILEEIEKKHNRWGMWRNLGL
jgi:Spy/CpxP family protein refolding chaperone